MIFKFKIDDKTIERLEKQTTMLKLNDVGRAINKGMTSTLKKTVSDIAKDLQQTSKWTPEEIEETYGDQLAHYRHGIVDEGTQDTPEAAWKIDKEPVTNMVKAKYIATLKPKPIMVTVQQGKESDGEYRSPFGKMKPVNYLEWVNYGHYMFDKPTYVAGRHFMEKARSQITSRYIKKVVISTLENYYSNKKRKNPDDYAEGE